MATAPAAAANDFSRTVKDAADIVKIIGEYVRLDKAGAQNYRGLCPFHKEKSPSFHVHALRQFYHCFGCGASGDVFTFVQKLENVTFPEALKTVAQKAGIAMPQRVFSHPEQAREAKHRMQLLEMHQRAAEFFQKQLQTAEGARAREYLTQREVSAELIQTFGIGYAPDGFTALRDAFRGSYPEDAMRASGLFGSKSQEDGGSGDLYDRFRKRITFPIRNEQGKVIAFTARALDSGDKAGPKYLNSPETPLYIKGHVLYGLDTAKAAVRQYDFALLVEGQMDAIRVYGAGIRNVLATSGTAFTEPQVRLLARFTQQVCVNFDPDTAGASAAEKSIAMLVEEGFAVKVLTLEDGLDPDRFIRERGVQAYVAALRAAPRHSDYLIERARKLFPPRTAENKVKAVNFLVPHIRRVQNRIARDEFASDAAQKLGVDSALLRQELKETVARRGAPVVQLSPYSESERMLLRALLADGADREVVRQHVLRQPETFAGLRSAVLLAALATPDSVPDVHTLDAAPEEQAMLARLLMDDAMPPDAETLAEVIRTLELRNLESRQREFRVMLAAAERAGEVQRMDELSREMLDLSRQIRGI